MVQRKNEEKQHEVDASEAFMQNEGTKHNLPKLLSCGLLIHKPRTYMGQQLTIFLHVFVALKYKCPGRRHNFRVE